MSATSIIGFVFNIAGENLKMSISARVGVRRAIERVVEAKLSEGRTVVAILELIQASLESNHAIIDKSRDEAQYFALKHALTYTKDPLSLSQDGDVRLETLPNLTLKSSRDKFRADKKALQKLVKNCLRSMSDRAVKNLLCGEAGLNERKAQKMIDRANSIKINIKEAALEGKKKALVRAVSIHFMRIKPPKFETEVNKLQADLNESLIRWDEAALKLIRPLLEKLLK